MSRSTYPEATVGALILNPEGEIFLFQSHKWKGAWAIPGGHIEAGESAADAVCREALEETGLILDSVDFLCYQECIYDPAFWQAKHFIFLDFVCRTAGGEVTLNDEAEAWKWVRIEELDQLDIEPFTRKTLSLYLQQFYPEKKESLPC
ncbi:MAG: NUDIX domain-containing protein [Candidatus Sericytochromatia bacterium]